MMLLFSARYRATGLFIAFAGLLGCCVASTEGLINVYRIFLPDQTWADGSYPYPSNFWEVNALLNNVSLCLLAFGIIALLLTKEPDEYFYNLRLESIQFAVYAQFVVGLVVFAYFYFTPGYHIENAFAAIIAFVSATFLLAYLIRYYVIAYFKQGND